MRRAQRRIMASKDGIPLSKSPHSGKENSSSDALSLSKATPAPTDAGAGVAGADAGIHRDDSQEVTEQTVSLTEEELERAVVPESAAAEEERLRQERAAEAETVKQALLASGENWELDKGRFAQLDKLLNQTDMYTKFLSEQMNSIEQATVEEAKAGSKRKAAAKGGKAKKAKTDGDAESPGCATKELLPLINGELRDYQLKGVRWLISLYQNGLNGILADQMGLGKTVQTIGFLSHLWQKGIHGPFMVIGPLSTLPNWVAEFERWCPAMPAVLYHGSKPDRQQILRTRLPTGKVGSKFPVIITSYEIVMADVKFLQKYHFKYIVVDEGHRLKNMNCKLLRELRTIRTENKLLLSGTPLQNNLAELWSLLNFLLPDVFSNLADFESWFDFSSIVGSDGATETVLAAEQRNRVVSKLHSILKPFLLRRIKADVEASLPAKVEMILYADMTDVQKKINEELLNKTLNETMAKMAKQAGSSSASVAKLNNVLMQMRKNCNHPDLITSGFDGSVFFPTPEQMASDCGKMRLVDRLLTALHGRGHKVLIFSQMTRMLDLLHSYLEQLGHGCCRIDGSVSWQERQEAMRSFNSNPDIFCFLLSTRAGGLGINLTAADTVIIYDSDWNPHQDLQAMDRCHRIGQRKPVLVLRLATANSVEGKMLRRANSKLMLEKLIIKRGAFLDHSADEKPSSMKADDLLELLRPDINIGDDAPQSGVVSDKVLAQLLDRSHLEKGSPPPYPLSGVGYEVVQQMDASGLLKGVE